MLRNRVRRWLGLDGPGGLANVLSVKDAEMAGLRRDVDMLADALRLAIPQLNRNTSAVEYHEDVLSACPATLRTKKALDARRARERKAAETPPETGQEPADQGEGPEAAEEMLTAPVADELAARRQRIDCRYEEGA